MSCGHGFARSQEPTDCGSIGNRMDSRSPPRSFLYSDRYARDPLAHCPTDPEEHGWAPVTHGASRRHAVFGKCFRDATCLHDVTDLRRTYLREVPALAHVSWRCHVFSPNLSSGSVCACPRVFATAPVFDGLVFGRPLHLPMCLFQRTCLRPTCLREASALAHVSSRSHVSLPGLSSRSVFACPCVLAPVGAFPHQPSLREAP